MKMMQQGSSVWESVVEVTKVAQEKGSDPLLWAIQISSTMGSFGASSPSTELAEVLVSYIFWDNNLPIAWKFLERALTVNLVPPMLVLALLSTRAIPGRRSHPTAYRLYLELLKRHAFTLKHLIGGEDYEKVIQSVDGVLHLSLIFGLKASEPGTIVVKYIFATVWQLLDASLDDEGLLELTMEKESKWANKPGDMDIDNHYSYNEKKAEHFETLQSANTLIAIETIALFLQDKVTSKILYLGRRNLPSHWSDFIQRIEIFGINSLALRKSRVISPEALMQLTSETGFILPRHPKSNSLQQFYAPVAFGPLPSAGLYHEASHSGFWLPLDLVLEDAMDGYQVSPTSAVEMITSLVKVLRASDGTTWHDTFLGLWIAALRLVQRERDPIEGPMPRLDTRLCMLLSITTLVIADLIDEEVNETFNEIEYFSTNHWKEKEVPGKRQKDLVSSLQMLGDYHGLLTPPQSVISAANQAAAKAIMFLSGISISSGYFESINMKDMPLNYSGNMRHLIVEACIARNLLDTSAYMWPGYVNGRINQIPHSMPSQVPGWSSFMKGAPLNLVMRKALVNTPASSLAELEKVYEVAIKGSDDEKISAATILCGASLIRGWNVQEHTVHFITSLLSPSVPVDHTGHESHLISCAPVLNVLLVGIGSVDCVQIFSLHGYVPHLAASLMPICEVFGSCVPNVPLKLTTGEEISAHAVFSNAFTLLLKLWRFNHPPLEHGFGEVPPVGSQLTPEYLLLIRNSHLLASSTVQRSRIKRGLSAVGTSASSQPMFLDSFPKLKVWYRQHLTCIASTLTGLVPGTPVHQIVDSLLNMMFRKINRGGQSVASGSSSSSGPISEDGPMRPQLPAWDILEAVPFVIDAALTACAYGRLSPRELATGLKDLADFLPACLATIISYFSAEVTRGIWKPVFMNGTDWPSPAANLSNVEEHIHRILAATGVDVPSLAAVESSPATLPLPLAAFVSLTITYKIDKASERFLSLLGPALESLAAGCPWPCMPIVASLWTQKAKRWSDFLIFSSSRTVFLQDNDAVVQLLKSCFSATLGLNATPLSRNGGVGALLGHGYISHFDDRISPVAPGILYLRIYRSIRDIMFIREEIVSVLMHSVRQIASSGLPKGVLEKLKKSKHGARYKQKSFSTPMTRVRVAASLAASLVWLSGGLALVQSLIVETLPSWFVSAHSTHEEVDDTGGMTGMLGGYVLAYFTMLCGAFAWSAESSSPASKRRPKVLGIHMEFLASAIDGKISLGCDFTTWRAYILGFVSLIVDCTPFWVHEVDTNVLKRLSKGLRQWKEEELALALLGVGGVASMGTAAEMIIESES